MLRLVVGRTRAPRMPFVMLVLGVLGGGLVGLLLLNSAAAADSFAQDRLRQENAALAVQEQELGREVAAMQAPAALAAQARKLGLVPSGEAGFLIVGHDGSSRAMGMPTAATAPPPPPRPSPSPSPTKPSTGTALPGTAAPPAASAPAGTAPTPSPTPRQ